MFLVRLFTKKLKIRDAKAKCQIESSRDFVDGVNDSMCVYEASPGILLTREIEELTLLSRKTPIY